MTRQIDVGAPSAFHGMKLLASESDFSVVVDVADGPFRLTSLGQVVAIGRPVTIEEAAVINAAGGSPLLKSSSRSDGMLNSGKTATFGSIPRDMRRQFTLRSALDHKDPVLLGRLVELGRSAESFMRELAPDEYAAQRQAVSTVLPEWRLTDCFTTGIINLRNRLPYHRDGGNFAGTWNMMYAISECSGGELVLGRYRAALRFSVPSLVGFDGQAEPHGVAPFGRTGRRITVVYYAMKGLAKSMTLAEERKRAAGMLEGIAKRRHK